MTDGGCLHHKGQVEVVSSRGRDGVDFENDLRWGVYVVFEAPSDYVKRCFGEYGLVTDAGGRYTALWRPYHLIGLELGISVAYVGLLQMPTGAARGFNADVVATAKRELKPGETLDGEGGYTVWGRLTPVDRSLANGALPIGLAHGVKLKNPIKAGHVVSWADVEVAPTSLAYRLRREMEATFAPVGAGGKTTRAAE
jgi:predicted homoserine dehydrogenase-like protein